MPHNDENWLNGKIEHIKRTEQEILNDFQKLGWVVVLNDGCDLILKYIKIGNEIGSTWIDKINRSYSCNTSIDVQEHELLHELFTAWRWF